MKPIFRLLVITLCLAVQSSAWAFLDFPQYLRWKGEMEGQMNTVFSNLVLAEERSQWKKDDVACSLGDINENACWQWIRRDENSDNYSESLAVLWKNMSVRNRTHHESVDSWFEAVKKAADKGSSLPIEWFFTPISKTEAIIERNYGNGAERSIQRVLIMDNWLVSIMYDQRQAQNSKPMDWQAEKVKWLQRISELRFE